MRGEGYILPLTEIEAEERGVPKDPEFFISFAFNHCLGDGLSMLAFARTYFSKLNVEAYNRTSSHLDEFFINAEPPPLLDNFIKASFLGIIVPAVSLLKNQILNNKRLQRFKSIFDRPATSESASDSPSPHHSGSSPSNANKKNKVETSEEPKTEDESDTNSLTPIVASPIISNGESKLQVVTDRTSQRFLFFDGEFSLNLRKRCKSNGTTIASALIVAGLAAVRSTYKDKLMEKGIRMPSSQGILIYKFRLDCHKLNATFTS